MCFEDIQSGVETLVRFRYRVLFPLVLVEERQDTWETPSRCRRGSHCLSLSLPSEEWIGSLSCDDSPLLGARMDDCGNPNCVHIVARFIDAHIISILLGCYTCGIAMVFGVRVRLMG